MGSSSRSEHRAPQRPVAHRTTGRGDRHPMVGRPKKAARPLRPGAFFRKPGRYKTSMRLSDRTCAMRFPCQKSPRGLGGSAARRDSPRPRVARWAVGSVVAEVGEWREVERIFSRNLFSEKEGNTSTIVGAIAPSAGAPGCSVWPPPTHSPAQLPW